MVLRVVSDANGQGAVRFLADPFMTGGVLQVGRILHVDSFESDFEVPPLSFVPEIEILRRPMALSRVSTQDCPLCLRVYEAYYPFGGAHTKLWLNTLSNLAYNVKYSIKLTTRRCSGFFQHCGRLHVRSTGERLRAVVVVRPHLAVRSRLIL
jgi:hypothetical protein